MTTLTASPRAQWALAIVTAALAFAILAAVLLVSSHRADAERAQRGHALACAQLAAGDPNASLADRYGKLADRLTGSTTGGLGCDR